MSLASNYSKNFKNSWTRFHESTCTLAAVNPLALKEGPRCTTHPWPVHSASRC